MASMPQSAAVKPAATHAVGLLTRIVAGFIAGFLSVLVVTSGVIEILHATGLIPFAGWSFAPVPPFGVPRSLSFAFWGGVWGVVYALLEPRLRRHLGWWLGGVVFGVVLPLSIGLFVVPALQAMPIRPGLAPSMLVLMVFLHALFGLSVATIYRAGLHRLGRTAAH
jgi:hypothetical protein